MSNRHSRNRKDSRGKTPEQVRRGLESHERRYAEAIEGLTEADFPLSTAGYLRGIRTMFAGPAFMGEGLPVRPGSEVAEVRSPALHGNASTGLV